MAYAPETFEADFFFFVFPAKAGNQAFDISTSTLGCRPEFILRNTEGPA